MRRVGFPVLFLLFTGLFLQATKVTANLSDSLVTDDEEQSTAFSLLVFCCLLISCLLVAFGLRESGFLYLHETGATILISMALGLCIRFISDLDRLKDMARFDPDTFFLYILPPIIFESGYGMRRRHFFMNAGGILLFAMVGTTISAFMFGGIVYSFGKLVPTTASLSGVESLVFGALISSTDPVTVLAIFSMLRVDVKLNANIFGESVLNDAVAIVMFRTILTFQDQPFTVGSFFSAILDFFVIFLGSMGIGILIGLLSALNFKYTPSLNRHPTLQLCLLILFAYASYLLAEGLHMSGIVSVLFCGIIMSHYTAANMLREAKHNSLEFFHTIAFLCESSIFVFLGLAMFSFVQEYNIYLIFISILACFISRAANIFPLSAIVNIIDGSSELRIPYNHQVVMWWGGLRGAMAFALAVSAEQPLHHHGEVILTTTLVIVLFTVLVQGGLTTRLLELLKVEVGVDSDVTTESYLRFTNSSRLMQWDQRWLKPFFTNRSYVPKPTDDQIFYQQLSPTRQANRASTTALS